MLRRHASRADRPRPSASRKLACTSRMNAWKCTRVLRRSGDGGEEAVHQEALAAARRRPTGRRRAGSSGGANSRLQRRLARRRERVELVGELLQPLERASCAWSSVASPRSSERLEMLDEAAVAAQRSGRDSSASIMSGRVGTRSRGRSEVQRALVDGQRRFLASPPTATDARGRCARCPRSTRRTPSPRRLRRSARDAMRADRCARRGSRSVFASASDLDEARRVAERARAAVGRERERARRGRRRRPPSAAARSCRPRRSRARCRSPTGSVLKSTWPCWPAMRSATATPSSSALCASIGPRTTSPIAQTFGEVGPAVVVDVDEAALVELQADGLGARGRRCSARGRSRRSAGRTSSVCAAPSASV